MTRRIGKYEIVGRLGRGGMAEVLRAYHATLDRYVAIKLLHKFLADDPAFRVRFEREARHIARLKHPNIVQVYDFEFDPTDDSYYMVMELIGGETLKDRLLALKEQGQYFPLDETIRIIRDAAAALSYAHKQGMMHRDVKPANLMLDGDGRLVLTDFGIAKLVSNPQITSTGGMVGTPAYMAPEQGMGELGDERADLYSLGVIMYEMLAGDVPYDADTPLGLILKHVNNPVPSLLELRPDLPPQVDALVRRLMAKQPEDRYATADELVDALDALTGGTAPAAASVPPATKRPAPAAQERPEASAVPVPPRTRRPRPAPPPPPPRRVSLPLVLASVVVIVLVAAVSWGVGSGMLAAGLSPATPAGQVAVVPEETDTPEPATASPTPEPTATNTATPSPEPSDTPEPTATATLSPTFTATTTTAAAGLAPTGTYTPSSTPDATVTLQAAQTATTQACIFDYAVIEHDPPDGRAGGFFRVNTSYTRQITLLNTGNCAWAPNTSLTFIEGTSFSAGPRIFIREQVEPAAEVTLTFAGTLPSRGSVNPITGTWELRTPGQIVIGEPLTISIMVFDPGG